MATVTIEGSRNLVYVDLNVSEASYDIGSNTSNVSYSVVIRKGSKSWNTSWASWGQKIYVSYSINGSSFTTYIPTYNYNGQVPPGSTIASGTINNISHNADGTKSIAFGISLTDNANGNNSGSYYHPYSIEKSDKHIYTRGQDASRLENCDYAAHLYKTANAGDSGKTSKLETLPPYYALCYIIKL